MLVVFGDEVGVAADRGVHFGAADFGHGRVRPVTALMTSGPVRNICEFLRVMMTKSISAGE